jgi:hypothetical protein
MTDGQDAQRRIPDWARRWVADLAATLGWSDEQTDEYIRIPDEVLTPVVADLTATLGWSREDAEEFVFENACSWESGVPRLVVLAESVQQRLHDDRIDTTWPACPDHPSHPLWLTRTLPAIWTCPSTDKAVRVLGELPP